MAAKKQDRSSTGKSDRAVSRDKDAPERTAADDQAEEVKPQTRMSRPQPQQPQQPQQPPKQTY
ncbi:hypothetical protein [Streptomyces sp. NPDC017095]|uniref:hypothetical protein n=1 Tax=Streptomyces sp. NPDC017095 TaxID=3364977 RepID=UPI0037B0EA24